MKLKNELVVAVAEVDTEDVEVGKTVRLAFSLNLTVMHLVRLVVYVTNYWTNLDVTRRIDD